MSMMRIFLGSASIWLVISLPSSLGHSEGALSHRTPEGLVSSTHIREEQYIMRASFSGTGTILPSPTRKILAFKCSWSRFSYYSSCIHRAFHGWTESRSYLTPNIAQLIGACSQHRAERNKNWGKYQALPAFFGF